MDTVIAEKTLTAQLEAGTLERSLDRFVAQLDAGGYRVLAADPELDTVTVAALAMDSASQGDLFLELQDVLMALDLNSDAVVAIFEQST